MLYNNYAIMLSLLIVALIYAEDMIKLILVERIFDFMPLWANTHISVKKTDKHDSNHNKKKVICNVAQRTIRSFFVIEY